MGLCSLQRTVARQESRLLWLREGDVPTKFFHTQANGRRWRNHIHSLEHDRQQLTSEAGKAEVTFQFFDGLMGTPAIHSNSITLEELDLSCLQLSELGDRFTEDKVWNVIHSLPLDKAPSSNGFNARFL
jgi:hypothetical protein